MTIPVTPILNSGVWSSPFGTGVGTFVANVLTVPYAAGVAQLPANNPAILFALSCAFSSSGPATFTATFAGLPCTCVVIPDASNVYAPNERCLLLVLCNVSASQTFVGSNLVVTVGNVSGTCFFSGGTASVSIYVDPASGFSDIQTDNVSSALSPANYSQALAPIAAGANDMMVSIAKVDLSQPTRSMLGTATYTVVSESGHTWSGGEPLGFAYRQLTASESDTFSWAYVTPAVLSTKQVAQAAAFVLKGYAGPSISQQPISTSVIVGQSATFSVTASGPALSYQWYENGNPILGATAAVWSTGPTALTDNGDTFDVVITNFQGSVTSSTAILTVLLPPVNGYINQFLDERFPGITFDRKLFFEEFVYYPMRPVREDDDLDNGFDPAVPNMIINRYKQQPTDTRKRGVDFTLFCAPGETISSIGVPVVTPVTTPPLVVTNILIDPAGQKFAYTASGGVDGTEYGILFAVSFNTGVTFDEEVIFSINVFSESQFP